VPSSCEITATVNGIMTALSSSQQSEVKAWEEEILACEHTLTLQQEPMIEPGKGELAQFDRSAELTSVPSQCSHCDLTSNLWLCLTCGLANCGRQQFGGIGGNGHALQHYKETGHGMGVKLGTITPEGHAGQLGKAGAGLSLRQTSIATSATMPSWILNFLLI
jgi:ubiquitin carboxyl-terminal hydrolase 5/13